MAGLPTLAYSVVQPCIVQVLQQSICRTVCLCTIPATFGHGFSGSYVLKTMTNAEEMNFMLRAGSDCAVQPLAVITGTAPWGGISPDGILMAYETPLANYLNSLDSSGRLAVANLIFDLVKRLHKAGIIHGDVKYANVVYSRARQRLLLIDFEYSQNANNSHYVEDDDPELTLQYSAPIRRRYPLSAQHPLRFEDDYWAAAITAWEVATGEPHFKGMQRYEIENALAQGQRPDLKRVTDSKLRGMIDSWLKIGNGWG